MQNTLTVVPALPTAKQAAATFKAAADLLRRPVIGIGSRVVYRARKPRDERDPLQSLDGRTFVIHAVTEHDLGREYGVVLQDSSAIVTVLSDGEIEPVPDRARLALARVYEVLAEQLAPIEKLDIPPGSAWGRLLERAKDDLR